MIIKVLLFVFFFKLSLFSCASGWDFNDKSFLFLEERKLPLSNQARDLKNPAVYNNIYYKYEERAKEENLKLWQEYLNQNLTLEAIEQIVYKGKNLSFIKDKDTKDYLDFVQNQEQFVVDYYYGEKKTEIKEEALIKEAIKRINTDITHWLKLRYFYLSLRLAHYKKLNPLEIYQEYKYLLEVENTQKDQVIVKDWIQGIYAGALIKNGKITQGVYEFSKLFNQNNINSHLAFYNFHHIKTQEQWNELISFSISNEEKAKLYTLRALNKNSNLIEELDNIYKIDKNSIWFDYLLYKALLDSQHFFDQHDFYIRNFPTKQFITYLQTIKKDDMYMINLSLGYFNLYSNNLKQAKRIATNLLSTKYHHHRYEHESQTFNYLVNLHQLENINTQIEDDIYKQFTKLTNEKNHSSKAIHDYTFVILQKLYKKQNNSFEAFLSANINYLNNSSFNLELLNQFNEFIKTQSKSKIQEHFKNKYKEQNKIKKVNNNYTFDESLKKTQIKLLINNLQFEKAIQIKSDYLNEKIKFNPFNVVIKGNNRSGKKQTYTVKQFLEKTIQTQAILKNNPNSVMDNYLYANALYNLSYFGNSNIITTEYRSVYSLKNKKQELEKVNQSIKYYEKALKYAKKEEFKAKITYMLAKSELAFFDIQFSQKSTFQYPKNILAHDLPRQWSYSNSKIYNNYIDNNYGKYFDKLEKDYSNTKYYQEIIKECANLRIYQKRKKY